MTDDEWQITVKDGTKVDGRAAVSDLRMLKRIIEREADALAFFYALAHGEAVSASTDSQQLFIREGELDPTVKAILLNGVVKGDSGIELHEPWNDSEQNRDVLNTIRSNRGIFLDRLRKEVRDQPDDQNPDRSR